MENIGTIVIVTIIIIIVLMYTSTCKKESYSPMNIPFDYESPVKQMQLDKFYEHIVNYINDFDRYGNPRPRRFEPFTDCRAQQSGRKELIIDPEFYYHKYRKLQDKVANLTNVLVRTQDVLDSYKKALIFCRRRLTMKPVVAKCVWPTTADPNLLLFRQTGNSITGPGVETQFRQGNTENA